MSPTLKTSITGVSIATAIVAMWSLGLVALLQVDLSLTALWWIPAAIVGQTFLYTGLFITAHDAMHGTVCPSNPGFNRLIGRVTVLLYALFSYKTLYEKHHAHHEHPVSDDDPDFHHPDNDRFWPWYLSFLLEYVTVWQIIGMAAVYNILLHLVGVSAMNLNLFWVMPSLLSTVQLFYFGTYLPHRGPKADFGDAYHARSNDLGVWMSFLTCYHFGGYHWEHHHRPGTPWWRLPSTRKTQQY
ncbi:fatty acid desaturase [Bradymonas sediminis]|uniref:Beta-carotene ketolase n=1 Tax=Bradymonas sediminis TaxID=1548548 RepID=A0A2Z4FHD2_9DELT|nr:fatty acid desaturase [Bradymonas sediminis]AWV88401.1 beta-carotene ketolase [Bradymonas sediminis]TDP77528.1 beta-carotene ketolase (CrtW type) [Bradymonas sediminis]